jgi:hypothetical protein
MKERVVYLAISYLLLILLQGGIITPDRLPGQY